MDNRRTLTDAAFDYWRSLLENDPARAAQLEPILTQLILPIGFLTLADLTDDLLHTYESEWLPAAGVEGAERTAAVEMINAILQSAGPPRPARRR